jgi:hypothetical protein
MSFLSPAFLWALPLIAVPVLIHFFARRQRENIRWGAMEFLLTSAIPRRRFLRLRDLLLMLLRVAIVLAILGALAQPMISSNKFGATGPRDVILILDNSMSTARKVGGGTVFDHELNEAARFIEQLNASDLVRVLLASPRPEWLSDSPLSADQTKVRELIARLRELEPNAGAADMLESVQEAIKAEPAGKDMPRFVTVVTDGQARSWRTDATGAWSAIQAFAKKASPPVFTSVIVTEKNSDTVANLAVEKLSATRAVVGVGQPVTLTASVKNTGTVSSQPTSLAWSANEQALGVSTVPLLQPGVGTTISLSQPFVTAGLIDLSCHLAAEDDLPADNSSRFLLEVSRTVPILVVEGEPQTDPVQSDTQYFIAALGYAGESKESAPASIFQPKVIGYQQLRGEELSAVQGVVLANIPRLPADLVQKLVRYVNSGGGLWIALGEQTDVDSFNQLFFEQSVGLSPLRLLQPTGDTSDRDKFTAVVPPAADHPATALLADIQRLDIDRARIYRRHQFEPDAGSPASVLLRVEGGASLAVEKSLGRGRVIIQTIPLGLAWSSLPLSHAYVVMVHEWLWYLTETGLVKRNLSPGELLQASQPVDSSNGSCALETPTGRQAQLVGEEEGGRIVFRYSKTLYPGEYRLAISDATQGPHSEKFIVNRDPLESDLTPLSEEQIKSLTETAGLGFGTDPLSQADSNQHIAAPPKAFAQWLLMALVLLMASEATIAFWLARQRRSKVPAVVMEPGIQV